jgi:hypothetical protein
MVIIKPEDVKWEEATTLEQLVVKLIQENRESELLPILKNLPPALKEKYRKLWKLAQEEKRKNVV